jgi:hypothetical protein
MPTRCSTTLRRVDWPERTKTIQRNWIGRSEGAEVCSASRSSTSTAGLHDAAGHAVRRDVLRAGARASARRAARAARAEDACASTSATRRAAPRSARRRRRTASSPAATRQPVDGRADPDLGRGLRADGIRDRSGSWPCRRTTSGTSSSRSATGCRSSRRRARGRLDRGSRRARSAAAHRDRAPGQLGRVLRAPAPEGARAISRVAGQARPRPAGRQLPPPRLGLLPGSATGAARSRSSTATSAGIVPVPEDELPVLLPEVETTGRRDPAARLQPGVAARALSALRRARGRREARRWTPSSTRPGTSCATAIHTTTTPRSTARSPTSGCRSTSTSAGSTTRPATCSTRASSSRS